jgi:nucleotide-binding universal stress UspA family protein
MSPTALELAARSAASQPRTRISRILVPCDFSPPSLRALEYGKDLARQFDAPLDVLHVVAVPYMVPLTDGGVLPLPPELEENAVADAREKLGEVIAEGGRLTRSTATVKTGDPRAEILDFAAHHGVDLIVMGTRGRTGVAHLIFGSVAEHVVRTAPCPVMTVR